VYISRVGDESPANSMNSYWARKAVASGVKMMRRTSLLFLVHQLDARKLELIASLTGRTADKAECQVVDEEFSIQLSRPDPSSIWAASSSMGVSFERPSDAGIDERFYVKVQCNSESSPHLLYDRSRSVSFAIMPNQPGHSELLKKVQGEKAFNGRKAYFKAAFDASNNLRVYPNLSSTTKKW